MKAIEAIRKFFGEGASGRKVEIQELKELSVDERKELGKLCCEALGETVE